MADKWVKVIANGSTGGFSKGYLNLDEVEVLAAVNRSGSYAVVAYLTVPSSGFASTSVDIDTGGLLASEDAALDVIQEMTQGFDAATLL
jgi:hypothetical protein